MSVALVEEEEIEVKNVFFTEQNAKASTMILDLGVPCSLVGKDWLDKYVKENGMKKENMKTIECRKKFRFGPGKIYIVDKKYVIPMVTMSSQNKELILDVQACEVDTSVPLLCGKDSMER